MDHQSDRCQTVSAANVTMGKCAIPADVRTSESW